MSDTVHLYTIPNWHLVRYLWPKGTLTGNQYIVYIDESSKELDKLRRVSPWLADQVAVSGNETVVVFTLHCDKRG